MTKGCRLAGCAAVLFVVGVPIVAVAATVRPVDDGRALLNPGMGWFMEYYSNKTENYGTSLGPGDSCAWFPGCSTCYLRVPWSYLEPEEGKFNWALVDTPAQRWIDRGGQIGLRITCSESWLRFATPEWVKRAGAKGTYWNYGRVGKGGPDPNGMFWDPDFGDPIFLAKLEKFLRAMASRYDGRREVAFVDIGSYGLWGEGHTLLSSHVPQEKTAIDVKKHIDLYVKCFQRTQLLLSDDVDGPFTTEGPSPILDYAREKGVGWRDDSILVQPPPKSWFHAYQAEKYWRSLPVVLEHEHYLPSVKYGAWNADLLAKSVEDMHASYLSIHGPAPKLYDDNQAAISQINRRLGYRLVPESISWPDVVLTTGASFRVTWSWKNVGVAPPYRDLFPALTVKDEAGNILFVASDGGLNLRTLAVAEPGHALAKTHDAEFKPGLFGAPVIPRGAFDVYVSVGEADGTPVIDLPLPDGDGHRRFRIGKVVFESGVVRSDGNLVNLVR